MQIRKAKRKLLTFSQESKEMIEVLMQRAFQDDKVTLGMIKIKNIKHPPIYTLENPQRDTATDSCIPEGCYTCVPYSSVTHKDVYEVNDVPGRTYILFHSGNFESDTLGCILLGNSSGQLLLEPAVMESKACMDMFRKLIGKNEFKLTIRNVGV